VRLDRKNLAIEHSAPLAAQIEPMAYDGPEVVLHEPLLDQMRLGERTPDLLGRKGDVPFDDDGARFGSGCIH
jgi:hypothetical protein